jgi:hypothetical protein
MTKEVLVSTFFLRMKQSLTYLGTELYDGPNFVARSVSASTPLSIPSLFLGVQSL